MDPLWFLIEKINSFLPGGYEVVGRTWGLPPKIAGVTAFGATVAFLFGLVYLGLLLSVGRLSGVKDNKLARGTIILIAVTMAIFAALYAEGYIVKLLSNLLYLAGMVIAFVTVLSILRAIWAGWYGAGATLHEAIAAEEVEKAKVLEHKKITVMGTYDLLNSIILNIYNNDPDAHKTILAERVINFLQKEKALAEKLFGLKRVSLYEYYKNLFGSHTQLKDYIENKIEELKKSKNKQG